MLRLRGPGAPKGALSRCLKSFTISLPAGIFIVKDLAEHPVDPKGLPAGCKKRKVWQLFMAVFLYLPPCELAEKLESLITNCLSQESIVIYRDINTFSRGLRHASSKIIGVILIETHQDLDKILLLGDVLWRIRTILVLPDSNPKTVARGHAIRPRFLTFQDGDLNEVATVLQRMTGTPVVPII